MKKFLPYILIIVVLVGLFVSTSSDVQAQTKPTCFEPRSASTPVTIWEKSTLDINSCNSFGKKAFNTAEDVYYMDGNLIKLVGICTINSVYTNTGSKESCIDQSGSWYENGTLVQSSSNNTTTNDTEQQKAPCRVTNTQTNSSVTHENTTREACDRLATAEQTVAWNPPDLIAQKQAEEDEAKKAALFGVCEFSSNAFIESCVVRFSFLIFITGASQILYFTAYLFNIMISLTLSSVLYTTNFLPEAWRIVRDFSNIFFILVLLYISLKMILGLGGAEVKKMIVNIIIAALLINFSMFITQVVIDSSNILALIFYNKIEVNNKTTAGNTPYEKALDSSKTKVEEKDIAGGIVAGFNPIEFLNPSDSEIFKYAKSGSHKGTGELAGGAASIGVPCLLGTIGSYATGVANPCVTLGGIIGDLISSDQKTLPVSVALIIIFTSGAVFLMASWAFFIAGLAFIGRVIELWILIIFSPFAFMSVSIPQLQSMEFLGMENWVKRLISTAFMAPIFMFMLLLISKIIQINFLSGFANKSESQSLVRTLIMLTIPAIIYISLLYKATDFAKKHSGDFGEAAIKYGKMAGAVVGGLALGAATGGAGLAASATIGRAGAAVGKWERLKNAESKGGVFGFGAARLRDLGKYTGSSSFDLRKAPGVGSLLKQAGIKTESSALTKSLGLSTEGGWEQRRKNTIEKRQKRAKDLEVGEDEKLKQNLNKSEQDLQAMLNKVTKDFEVIDKEIENQRKKKSDSVVNSQDDKDATDMLNYLKLAKKGISDGMKVTYTINGVKRTADQVKVVGGKNDGKTISQMQGTIIPEQKNAIVTKNRERKTAYSKSLTKNAGRRVGKTLGLIATYGFGGMPAVAGVGAYALQHNSKAEREAAHAIIMEVKLPETGTK